MNVGFEVMMVRDLAGKFGGRKTFIEILESIVPEFYEQVGQHLRSWVPPPPKLKAKPTADTEGDTSRPTAASGPKAANLK